MVNSNFIYCYYFIVLEKIYLNQLIFFRCIIVIIFISVFNSQITNDDNPYLDHIVTNLWRISKAGTKVSIPPFPLEWLYPPFECSYYSYNGSLTQPPCTEMVTWIIQPEPIAISSFQVKKK